MNLAPRAGLEPATNGLTVHYSHLSKFVKLSKDYTKYMEYFASIFKKKFNNILAAEKINATALANKAGITIVVSYDYRSGRATPSSLNLTKLIKAFPQYTCYLLDLDPKELPKQIIFKE
ncbi:hypothetical protein BSPLISOX_1303 [uncultured Gammaproteobacteria bacterium]|nr:hypothetical protein BSPLISOX_1303 [uncultured Gammaproteobacteria bacterium]